MAYDPLNNNLPQLDRQQEQIINNTVALEKADQIGFLEKRIFRGLLIFSIVVVVIAGTAVGLLFINQTINDQADSINSPSPDSNQVSTDSDVDKDPIENELDPEDSENTDSTTDSTAPDLAGWLRLELLEGQISVLIPPAEEPHITEVNGEEYSWIFGELDSDANSTIVGEYEAGIYIGYLPYALTEKQCGAGCIQENVVYIRSKEATGTLEETLERVREKVGSENLQNLVNVRVGNSIGYAFDVTAAESTQSVVIIVNGEREFMVDSYASSKYPQSVQDSQQILNSIEFN